MLSSIVFFNKCWYSALEQMYYILSLRVVILFMILYNYFVCEIVINK